MKYYLFVLCILILLFSTISCATALMPPGAIYTDITTPQTIANYTTYQITPESDFEGIAYVEGIAEGEVILGLVATGNFGYGAAIEDALSKAPGATRLVDVIVDTQVKSILGIYVKYITKVRGRAVRIKKK